MGCRCYRLVRVTGVEPARLAAQDPKSWASASSAIPAKKVLSVRSEPFPALYHAFFDLSRCFFGFLGVAFLLLLQFTSSPPCAPFSTIERGQESPRWHFCCFRYRRQWIPGRTITKISLNSISNMYIFIFYKFLGILGRKFAVRQTSRTGNASSLLIRKPPGVLPYSTEQLP